MNASGGERDALLGLLAGWTDKAKSYRDAHQNASVRLRRWHYLLGVPAIILSSIVAMSVFATLQRGAPIELAVAVGVISVCAAVLAACQTFLRSSDRAEVHRQASAEYEGLAERAELVAALYRSGPLDEERLAKFREACTEVQGRMSLLATRRPEVSERDPKAHREAGVAARPPASATVPPRREPRAALPAPIPTPAPTAATTSSIPPPGAAAPVTIPPPARLPPATLPPVRAPSIRPPMPSAADASAGRRSSSSEAPPGMQRWERRASQSPAPPLVETGEKEEQKAQRSP